jgi:hypothetical protein
MRKSFLPCAFIVSGLIGMTISMAICASRLGGEDVVFSYAPENDRLVFGGISYASTVLQDMDHADKSVLYVQDLKSEQKTKVFDAGSDYVGNAKVAPSGTAIAVQVSQEIGFRNPRLLILSLNGKVLASFQQGREFSWSQDSRFLAFTTGVLESVYEMKSTGTWLYDLRLQNAKKIFDKGDYIGWSRHDQSLYIWDEFDARRHIFRYDLVTGGISPTNFQGIHFSPTGRYYHGTRSHGIGTVDVFETKTNQPFISQRPKIAKLMRRARIIGWAPEGDVLILEVHRPELSNEEDPYGRTDTVLYDVPNDIARIIPGGSILGWQRAQAVVREAESISKRSLTTLPLLPDKP